MGNFEDFCERTTRRYKELKRLLKDQRKKYKSYRKYMKQQFGKGATIKCAYRVTGLQPGVAYQFAVSAINRVGESELSPVSSSTHTASAEPERPRPPVCVDLTMTS